MWFLFYESLSLKETKEIFFSTNYFMLLIEASMISLRQWKSTLLWANNTSRFQMSWHHIWSQQCNACQSFLSQSIAFAATNICETNGGKLKLTVNSFLQKKYNPCNSDFFASARKYRLKIRFCKFAKSKW